MNADISTIEAILEDARDGLPYILVDADDRENEGDIIIPAQFATPSQINFMARHARGLICLAMTGARAEKLELPPMTANNQSGHGTAFTVSIEAREGVTTGISAQDRAHTIAVAIDPTKSRRDIVSPGHVFPLVAKEGGVLVRAGHTEAAVDISRLAGLNPAGVICEVMNDDGTMARLPELIQFGQQHGLKIGTIADLIAYRRRSERIVTEVATAPFDSVYGNDFTIHVYRNSIDGGEHIALVRGNIHAGQPTLVRVHQVDLTADLLGWSLARRDYVPRALSAIAARVNGGRRAYHETHAIRDYGVGAQILRDLGVQEMILLTSSNDKLTALEGFGLSVVGRQPIPDERVTAGARSVAAIGGV
jgi:3,4-dihydroxy 2-butanone 4-phosphate synthase/GTP cyclohydrolase II